MKGFIKIIMRYVLSAGGIAIIILLINFILLISWIAYSSKDSNEKYSISEISDKLKRDGNNFILSDDVSSLIKDKFEWAMLLSDDGKVIWSENLPEDVPLSYKVSDIASFSRWYLNDYPIKVWKHPDGLFVLGDKKNSTWKFVIEIPQKVMENSPKWLAAVLIINFITAIFLAFLFGIRFFLYLRKVVNGIENMSEKKPVSLSIKGTFKDLANNINITSKELIRQQKLIEKRDTARNNWITAVSHDIRTPLSMIMGYSSDLEDNSKFSEEDRKQFSVIRFQSEKIKQLVNDLNLAVKLEYEMQPLNMKNFYIAEVLRKVVVEYLNNLCNDKYTINLSISDEAQGFKLNGDIRLFERALNNIIGNSIKHNNEGCDIFIDMTRKFNGCQIEIKDNGSGFDNNVLEKLNFSTEMPNGVSHGLGLFIVKQIITVHGGTIQFRNWENGSDIVIYI
ncbi:sensor histidine kinase [Clostridium saccharobutylicum]|uniref:histidine kinase n=2 Tax=Clostridium saccharobutylicum TaxID=169679 RepID=U5MUI9_CLOSA|nr:HAMP domain-containing sensor histidine kinase [Clostridium saccharobutylicum]AGX43107.1 sensor histidine kinase YvrG [Clostridium saccharobutylicum DSM 13864]AQR90404.1 sensor protein KdpD [Clostridium saccharobutylicum]AQS00310.1 sensor protein KdpD [Clostridium saccharobutylicum]AQS14293.1 sensor protein KdpD [Clostridium saccharobutylicum]MBA2907026.1 signal transduction histidine kinase [Clostridium saccharobutylicum]